MHNLHFACNYNGFGTGFMFCVVFVMLGSIDTNNQRKCDHSGFNIRGGLISGKWALVCTTSCDSQICNYDRDE